MHTTPEYRDGIRHGLQVAVDSLQQLQACSDLTSDTDRRLALATYLVDHVLPALDTGKNLPRLEHLQFMVDDHGHVQAHVPEPEPFEFIPLADLLKEKPSGRGASTAEGCNLPWPELVALEPQLADLLREAEAVRDLGGRYFCANRIWYAAFKPRLQQLVGWCSDHHDPRLRTSCSYATAYETIYHALPDCRNCSCF